MKEYRVEFVYVGPMWDSLISETDDKKELVALIEARYPEAEDIEITSIKDITIDG